MRERRGEEYTDTQWVKENQRGNPTGLEHQSQYHLQFPIICSDCKGNMIIIIIIVIYLWYIIGVS
jgi:hypothetical protein